MRGRKAAPRLRPSSEPRGVPGGVFGPVHAGTRRFRGLSLSRGQTPGQVIGSGGGLGEGVGERSFKVWAPSSGTLRGDSKKTSET